MSGPIWPAEVGHFKWGYSGAECPRRVSPSPVARRNSPVWKAILAATVVYLVADAAGNWLLDRVGLGYLHAFIAMFCGMFVGGYLAGRNFI